ncbi:MAG: ABC transporter permease, partial [Planctomycetes bacterium]|nr:ABC transporter permease [Planctomycetota bacterium]
AEAADKPAVEAADKPAVEPADKPAAEAADKPAAEAADKPAAEEKTIAAPTALGSALSPPLSAPQLGTRLVGLAWLLAFGTVGFVLVQRVYSHDFGTTNARVLSVIRLASVAMTAYPALLGLLTLLTGRRPPARFNPLGLPLDRWWYQGLNALTWRELKRVFFHPVAYIVLFVYLVLNGFLLAMLIYYYAGAASRPPPLPAAAYLTNNFYLWLSLILICPALTMGLLAEERRTRSLELLLTAPVTETQVVLSKFGAVACYFLFMSSFSLGYAALIKSYSVSWDWGPILSGYLGLLLIGLLATAIGVFTSSLTRSQILAYLVSAVALVGMFLLAQALIQPGSHPVLRAVLEHFSVTTHQDLFASGIISWRSVTYYLTSTTLFLFLAVRGLAAQGGR